MPLVRKHIITATAGSGGGTLSRSIIRRSCQTRQEQLTRGYALLLRALGIIARRETPLDRDIGPATVNRDKVSAAELPSPMIRPREFFSLRLDDAKRFGAATSVRVEEAGRRPDHTASVTHHTSDQVTSFARYSFRAAPGAFG